MSIGPTGPEYYLTDGRGWVVALADASAATTARFEYDGFGQLRSSSGPSAQPAASIGGGFRFQGMWLESATGFYSARARDYDPRTGRFLSRDLAQPDLHQPQTLEPYSFARSNPFLYHDPTGMFSIIEINMSLDIEDILDSMKGQALSYVENQIKDKVRSSVLNAAIKSVATMFTEWNPLVAPALADADFGKMLEGNFKQQVCEELGRASSIFDYIHLEVSLGPDGTPVNDGVTCKTTKAFTIVPDAKRADFGFRRSLPCSSSGDTTEPKALATSSGPWARSTGRT